MQKHEIEQLARNDYAKAAIRVKALQLRARVDFGKSERPDIEQELWLHLLTQAPNFDPKRASLNTFIDRMVNSAACMLIRNREREVRAEGFHTQPLDTSPADEHPRKKTLRSTLTTEDGIRHRAAIRLGDLEALEDCEAWDVALASLSPEQREVCTQIMDGTPPYVVANRLGMSRRQLNRTLDEIRARFERAGFRKFSR